MVYLKQVIPCSIAGCLLFAAEFFAVEGLMANKAIAETGNWMSIGGTVSLDLNSAKTQPNGVTTFRFRGRVQNPINGKYFFSYFNKAIDCKTLETVNLTEGTREPFQPWTGRFTGQTTFSQIGYRSFCK